jgi:hypothetical protein
MGVVGDCRRALKHREPPGQRAGGRRRKDRPATAREEVTGRRRGARTSLKLGGRFQMSSVPVAAAADRAADLPEDQEDDTQNDHFVLPVRSASAVPYRYLIYIPGCGPEYARWGSVSCV